MDGRILSSFTSDLVEIVIVFGHLVCPALLHRLTGIE
jgi:hypothetical protein